MTKIQKTNASLGIKLTSVLFFSSLMMSFTGTAFAQGANPVVEEAKKLCIDDAKSKGFELKEVVSAEPSDVAGKDAKVILNLVRQGQESKLTCYYDKNAGRVGFNDESTAAPTASPWWWLLVPLIGIPLLWFLFKNRDGNQETRTPVREVEVGEHERFYNAVVVGESINGVSVHEQPSHTSNVIKTVYKQDKLQITYNNPTDNWVRLSTGGWVPRESIEILQGA